MKNIPGLIRLVLPVFMVGILAAASVNADDKTNFITTGEITAMTPRTATFAKRLSGYSGSFTNADGSGFVLGDIRGEQWVWHFVGALKEGRTYKFPDAFTNYMAAPSYVTAKEITAMAPCTATIASRTPCSSHFVTTDGKWFGIGDPGSGAKISGFIWSIKDGQTNKFPDVFTTFLAAPTYSTAKEITGMAPRNGTLVKQFRDLCYFTTPDGKGFFIGSPDSAADNAPEITPEVDRFLRTLQEDKIYKFPDAFVKYQQSQQPPKP